MCKRLFYLFILSIISFSVFHNFIQNLYAESLDDAVLRSGCVIGYVNMPETLTSGKNYSIKWMIQSYVPILSRLQIKYSDGTKDEIVGNLSNVEEGSYYISSKKSKNYYFNCALNIPLNIDGTARVGFHNSQDDNESKYWMYGLFPTGVIKKPVGTAGKQFYVTIEKDIVIPVGFKLIQSAEAVKLFKKDYSGGKPDYVQVINLENGASVKLLYGSIENKGSGEGVYGGDNPKFKRASLSQFWSTFSSNYGNAFSIVNGQFFDTNSNPAALAFPLKSNGRIISDGYGISEFTNQKLILEIWSNKVDIKSLTKQNLINSSASNILAGLSEDANKGISNQVARTFAGIMDSNNNGTFETLLIFTSSYANQSEAASVLRSFGASKIIMFDGGGSSQLICEDEAYVSSSRTIPQAIGVISAK